MALIWDCEGETEPDVLFGDVVEDDDEEPAPEVDVPSEDVDVVPEETPVEGDPAAAATADCQPKASRLTAHSRSAVAGRDARRRPICRRAARRHGWWAAALPACSSATWSRLVLCPRFEKGFLLVNMVFV